MSVGMGMTGREFLKEHVGLVKTVCGSRRDFFYDFLQEQMRLVKSVGAGGCGQEYLWEQVGLIKSGCGSGWD